MKMVKSLLLGSAAGVVAVSGAQAADLPVKAQKVEYVRICPQYGKGFFYLPGSSDVCLSITGFVRFQVNVSDGTNSGGATPSTFGAPQGADVRANGGNILNLRARYMMTFDSRAQTAYGTLRAVATAGFTYEGNPAATVAYANRGFIQIAGFTMGRAVSFFDFYSAPATSYHATMTGDTGDGGWTVFGYTAQFGGGVSATIAAEDPRRTSIVNTAVTAAGTLPAGGIGGSISVSALSGAGYTNSYAHLRMPDVVANLRWDQPWGSIQVMGALHDVASGYYVNPGTLPQVGTGSGHPSAELGWAVGAGVKLNIGQNRFDSQFTYTQGALRYLIHAQSATSYYQFGRGADGEFGYGIFSDGVFAGPGSSIELTTGWGVNLSYDHRWSPTLKTSIYGSYISISYNGLANGYLCAAQTGTAAGTGGFAGATFARPCDQDWKTWYIGSRTQWDVAKGFYVGVDVLYHKLETANSGLTTAATYSPGTHGTGVYRATDQSNWSFVFRAHRDIIP
jgi:hypothetical protein